MDRAARTSIKAGLSLVFVAFCLPTLGYGAFLLYEWFRSHTSNVYYTDYWYLPVALILLGAGVLSLWTTWSGVLRRSFYGLLFVVPVFFGLTAMVEIPNIAPRFNSMEADSNYLSDVQSFFRAWYEDRHNFPANNAEFAEALAKGPAAWQYRVDPPPASAYRKQGQPVPYEIIVENNATGPRLSNMSERPGVVYYCVSEDLQEFWVTMTALSTDYGSSASIKRVPGLPNSNVWMAHANGKEYPVRPK